ncbi:MAG: glycosyltransferase family 39 protein [Anaerolineaceae bacterium]|nr:glycosyltransferase family 39 protein [Anaerolineaceae bacterium]MDE0328952.1 glycosyltransferase family 39 protein [Anaerolineaceae bacterium]
MKATALPGAPPRPLWPARYWWLTLLVLLLLAGGLRFTGYNFGLPYIDHPDEPNQFLAARLVLDQGTSRSIGKHSYPPGIVALHYLFVRYWQDPAQPPSIVTGPVRLIAIGASLLGIALLALLGYHGAGPPAGLIAAGIAAVTPWLVDHSRFATADSFTALFSLLALWLTLAGVQYRRPGWTTWAGYALMLAALFKYQALFLTPLVTLAPLLAGASWRRVVAGNALRLALFLAWLFLLTPALEAGEDSPIRNWRQVTQLTPAALLQAPLGNLGNMLGILDLRLLAPGWAGLALLTGRARQAWQRLAALYLLLAALAVYLGVGLFGEQPLRLLLTSTLLLLTLSGIGWAQWLALLRERAGWRGKRRDAPALAAFALMLLLALPSLQGSLANAYEHTLPDRRNDLASWADTTLPAGRFIATVENHKTLNRDWGGYPGVTAFDFAGQFHLGERPLADWRADGVDFAILPWRDYAAWLDDDPQGYLAGTTLLKAWPPSDANRGPSMVVLALRTPTQLQTAEESRLGSIRLLGHDLDVADVRPGVTFAWRFYWQADAPTDGDYVVFNHLLDADGVLVAQVDGPPLPDTRRGTSDWDDPQETIISHEFRLQLPEDLAAGEYMLVTGWYGRETGQRLPAPDGRDHLLLGAFPLPA